MELFTNEDAGARCSVHWCRKPLGLGVFKHSSKSKEGFCSRYCANKYEASLDDQHPFYEPKIFEDAFETNSFDEGR